jgi:intraflagellar transport protein 80
LAIKHKTHIDTVLAYREQYLQDVGCQETLQQFMQYAGKVLPHCEI